MRADVENWNDTELRERLRAVVRHYATLKARRWKVARPANDPDADTKVIPFPRPPRLPMHR